MKTIDWKGMYGLIYFNNMINHIFTYTAKPELGVTFIKQPTCLKQPYRMFPKKIVLIFTFPKQPPVLNSHFLCFPCVAAKHRFDLT